MEKSVLKSGIKSVNRMYILKCNKGVLKSVKSVQNGVIVSKLRSYSLIPAN